MRFLILLSFALAIVGCGTTFQKHQEFVDTCLEKRSPLVCAAIDYYNTETQFNFTIAERFNAELITESQKLDYERRASKINNRVDDAYLGQDVQAIINERLTLEKLEKVLLELEAKDGN